MRRRATSTAIMLAIEVPVTKMPPAPSGKRNISAIQRVTWRSTSTGIWSRPPTFAFRPAASISASMPTGVPAPAVPAAPPAAQPAPGAATLQDNAAVEPLGQARISFDYTHLGTTGADFFARMVTEHLAVAVPALRRNLIP